MRDTVTKSATCVELGAAVLLLWGGALLWAALDLRGRADALLATLGRIEQEQRIRSDGLAKYGALPFTWYQSAAQGLMDSMLSHDDSLVYLAIPASCHWPGRQGLDQRIDQRFTEGLENIVLRTLAKGLNLQAVALSGVGQAFDNNWSPITLAPDGTAYILGDTIMRARYRNGYDHPAPLTPGQVATVQPTPLTISNTFQPGHRIRVEVTSSNFPKFVRNLNTGGLNETESQGVVADNTVHHAGDDASYIDLPVVK